MLEGENIVKNTDIAHPAIVSAKDLTFSGTGSLIAEGGRVSNGININAATVNRKERKYYCMLYWIFL